MTGPPDPRAALAEASLSTGGVARLLGVSPTTVRSWERRYGIGPVGHESGRHRRWRPQDVRVVTEMCRLTARGVPPAEAARLALLGAADRGSTPTAESATSTRAGTAAAETAGAARAPGEGGPDAALAEGTGGERPAGQESAGRPASGHAPGEQDSTGREPGGRESGGSAALPLGTVRPECRGLARAAVRLDAGAVERILQDAVRELGLITAWDEVMMPALRAAGRKWASEGERYVEVEHLLSWHVSTTLRRTAHCPPVGPVPPVLLAGMPAELHSLPLDAVAAGLAERGLPFRMFGAAVPAEALLAAVRRTGPSAVLLWSQAPATADRRLALQAAATAWGVHGARARPAVLLAGPGWAGGATTAGTLRPRGLADALEHLTGLLGT
ncbi:MerR family transcriptional regulator [Kitasatospora sp. NBC_00315]|uniref:MerR family transcriptional regulator n=1 Tax=Kitasatospora sp. NBC_00315 TaxID=2975963 RepID=UPI0032517259